MARKKYQNYQDVTPLTREEIDRLLTSVSRYKLIQNQYLNYLKEHGNNDRR